MVARETGDSYLKLNVFQRHACRCFARINEKQGRKKKGGFTVEEREYTETPLPMEFPSHNHSTN